jgi:TadE-like protein
MGAKWNPRSREARRGQAMVELALILPLFLTVVFGIIILGIGLFYQQEVTNAAREAARYAAIHSATAQASVVGHLDPGGLDGSGNVGTYPAPDTYQRYYTPDNRWQVGTTGMTPYARQRIFGLNTAQVFVAACWSGWRNVTTGSFDAPPPGTYDINDVTVSIASSWDQCRIDGHDPTTDPNQIGCSASLATEDKASSMSEGPGVIVANKVTAYACFEWEPPLAGFLLIPQTVTLRGVISEPIQRQQ